MDPNPTVFVGPKVMKLPLATKPALGAGYSFYLEAISEDGRTVAGTAMSIVSDPNLPYVPVIWRCE
jgi:hypothetical protein